MIRGDARSFSFRRSSSAERISVALLAATLSAPLRAQDVEDVCRGELEEFEQPPFEAFDANRDDYVARTESESCRSLHMLFDELDANDDRRLSRIEYADFGFFWAQRAWAFGLDR